MEPNKRDAVAVSSVTAKSNADGSITVHFGGPEGRESTADYAWMELHRKAVSAVQGTT